MHVTNYLQTLTRKEHLTTQQAQLLLRTMMNNELSATQIGAHLTALSMKGETADEIIGFIQTMREHMQTIDGSFAMDVCGTGGDGKNAFNISTAVAFVVAGAGVPVAKHGNRAASSKSGSADVLEALGVTITLSPEQAEKILKKIGIVFLFAPLYHHSMKQVSQIRKELQIPTIFNYLGPFTSPAGVKRQLVGVSNIRVAKRLTEVATKLQYEHLIIAATEDQFDEVSMSASSTLYEVKGETVRQQKISPEQFGFTRVQHDALTGGTVQENANIIAALFDGKPGPKRDIVLLNSAVALYVSGKVKTIEEGIREAKKSIDGKFAKQLVQTLVMETKKYA